MGSAVNASVGNRLRGSLPRIGVRPVIDGRYGGVRESLEEPVLQLARSVAGMLQSNLRHACGMPVETIMPPFCIGGVAEAAACEELFLREGAGLSISVTPSWCYGSETIDMNPHRPKAIWGFNGTERPGAVYLAAALAGHTQKGMPAFGIYGRDVQDMGDPAIPADVQAKILQFARAGLAVATMRGASYLSMGGISMGIAGTIVDHSFFEEFLGMRCEAVDMTEFIRRIDLSIFDLEELERALAWTRSHCTEGDDPNPPERQRSRQQKDDDWVFSVKMALIARDLMVGNRRLADLGFLEESRGHNAIAAGFQGQRQWTDHWPNGDFLEAILTSSFDWNGSRQPYMVATENDSLNAVSMLFGNLLTGTAQLFADVRTYWSPEAVLRVTGHTLQGRAEGGVIHLINSGPAALDWTAEQTTDGRPAIKPFWEAGREDAERCLQKTRWCPGILEYFRGSGYSTDFLTRGGMPVTMCRINIAKGLGPALNIAEGWTVELPPEVHDVLDRRTNPTWPTTWFVPNLNGQGPFRDVYSVMNAWGANHGAISVGHIGGDLAALASMLRIPVAFHNLESDRIFRPASWTLFGGLELQNADYRACKEYGPLYR
ncbi:MAG: L-fucose isomerase [Armatimonadetes bacterium]|nr:L-fucose isomerase [Armatimonadota bacterium]MDE2207347.1 L-fucose isomerase [Armatimonadota bacterium]